MNNALDFGFGEIEVHCTNENCKWQQLLQNRQALNTNVYKIEYNVNKIDR